MQYSEHSHEKNYRAEMRNEKCEMRYVRRNIQQQNHSMKSDSLSFFIFSSQLYEIIHI